MKKILCVFKKNDVALPQILSILHTLEHSCHYTISKHYSEDITHTSFLTQYADFSILLIFGGDGTILNVAHKNILAQIPILGINTGTLGFMTKTSLDNTLSYIESCNNAACETIPLLELLDATSTSLDIALNEVCFSRGNLARTISLTLETETECIYTFKGDGLVIATPYGSTAYSRSAGGSLLHPKLNAFIATPLLPSSKTLSPVVFSNQYILKISIKEEDAFITCDGQRVYPFIENAFIRISSHTLPFLALHENDYFTHLNKKYIL
ncbi:MAG: NAD(+)/NADH kinase [Desulfovibrionaceae bacterium]